MTDPNTMTPSQVDAEIVRTRRLLEELEFRAEFPGVVKVDVNKNGSGMALGVPYRWVPVPGTNLEVTVRGQDAIGVLWVRRAKTKVRRWPTDPILVAPDDAEDNWEKA